MQLDILLQNVYSFFFDSKDMYIVEITFLSEPSFDMTLLFFCHFTSTTFWPWLCSPA